MAAPIVSAVLETATTGLRGYVVIDALVGGRAMGGTRMTATVCPSELARLARQMTLKLGLAGLAIGGAKAGIVNTGAPPARRAAQLRSFGRAAAPFLHGGVYLGADQGISYADRAAIFEAAGYDVAARGAGRLLPCGWADLWERCCDITGHGVAEATAVAVEQTGVGGTSPTVAIQGFGTVGRGTAKRLVELGFRLVAVADHLGTVSAPAGLPLPALLAATDAAGTIDRSMLPPDVATSSAPDAWLDVEVDVLVLAAVGGAVRCDNVERVRARVVVEGANEPCTDDAIAALGARGISVVPGIVANCGGAMVTGLVLTGGAPTAADTSTLTQWLYDRISTHVRATLTEVFDRARAEHRTLPAVAVALGDERVAALRGDTVDCTARAAGTDHRTTESQAQPS